MTLVTALTAAHKRHLHLSAARAAGIVTARAEALVTALTAASKRQMRRRLPRHLPRRWVAAVTVAETAGLGIGSLQDIPQNLRRKFPRAWFATEKAAKRVAASPPIISVGTTVARSATACQWYLLPRHVAEYRGLSRYVADPTTKKS